MIEAKNIIEVIKYWAEMQPDKTAYTILNYEDYEDNASAYTITYQQLIEDISLVAGNLQTMAKPKDFALLCFARNEMYQFIKAFYGCLASGIVAVPLYPPKKQYNEIIEPIVNSLHPNLILTTLKTKQLFDTQREMHSITSNIKFVLMDDMEPMAPYKPVKPTLAFIQYTSGSTSLPKGVMISHQNILANQEMIKKSFSHNEKSDFVGWLPLHHDMGLIGNIIQPIYIGARSVIMSPISFFQKPMRWLQAISDFKAHTSGGPNFAYQLCVDEFNADELKSCDLSCWNIAFNGAEPIHYKTLQLFSEKFSDYKFKSESFYPCYGLAEATLFVTGAEKNEGAILSNFDKTSLSSRKVLLGSKDSSATLVSSGYTKHHNNVVIANPDNHSICEELAVGEILIAGKNVSEGYWGLEKLSKEQFGINIGSAKKHYYKTGDLGFIYNDNLYVVGRLKDLIIIRGENYYPHDIEIAAKNAHPLFIHNQAAAFEITQAAITGFIIALEINRHHKGFQLAELKEIVTQKLVKDIGVKPLEVIIVRERSLPLTTSGKIKRSLIKQQYIENKLSIISQAPNQVSGEIKDFNANFLNFLYNYDKRLKNVSLTKAPEDYGLDSLDTVRLINKLNKQFSAKIELNSTDGNLNFQKILELLSANKTSISSQQTVSTYHLIPNQVAIYMQQKIYSKLPHYILSETFCLEGKYELEKLKNIIKELVIQHPIINSSIFLKNEEYCIRYEKEIDELLKVYTNVLDNQILQAVNDIKYKLIEFQNTRLAKISFFIINENKIYINLSIHHMIFDLWSAGILLTDFYKLFNDETLVKCIDYSEYSQDISEQLTQYETKWTQNWQYMVNNRVYSETWPNKLLSSSIGPRKALQENFSLDPDQCDKLHILAEKINCNLFDILLASYAFTMYKYSSQQNFVILSPFNGRTNTRYNDTLGYFVKTLPFLILVESDKKVFEFIQAIGGMVKTCRQLQNYPGTKIFDLIKESSNAQNLLPYQLMFTYQKLPFDEQLIYNNILLNQEDHSWVKDEITITHISQKDLTTEVDLDMAIFPNKNTLNGYIKYSKAQYDSTFIKQLIGHFKYILDLFTQNPNKQLKDFNILSDFEMMTSIKDFNKDNVNSIPYNSLYEIFSETTSASPEQIAIQDENNTISYKELANRVDILCELLGSDSIDDK